MPTAYVWPGQQQKKIITSLKILVLETREFWREQLAIELKNEQAVEILWASTIEKAEKLLSENPDLDIIVIDDGDSGSGPTTLDFVCRISNGFKGIMIACSSNCNYGEMLVGAGCEYWIHKSGLMRKILEYLGQPA